MTFEQSFNSVIFLQVTAKTITSVRFRIHQ